MLQRVIPNIPRQCSPISNVLLIMLTMHAFRYPAVPQGSDRYSSAALACAIA